MSSLLKKNFFFYIQGVETGAGSEDEAYGGAAAPASGQHVFDYIERLHQKTPVFYNFLYTPDLDNPVSF